MLDFHGVAADNEQGAANYARTKELLEKVFYVCVNMRGKDFIVIEHGIEIQKYVFQTTFKYTQMRVSRFPV